MVRIAKMVWNDFDIYLVSGFRESIPIPPQDCATTIVRFVLDNDKFLPFIEALILVDQQGIMGRRYPISNLREIIKALMANGFAYDGVNNLFLEDGIQRKSLGWGRLQEGNDYNLALLRLDIVHNSKIVRDQDQNLVILAYAGLRELISHKVEKRLGRIWNWEGDGGMAAFFYGHRQQLATLAAIDILHGLFLFNRLKNPLGVPISLRLALHTGHIKFATEASEWKKSDVVKQVVEMESKYTAKDSLTISSQTEAALDRTFATQFLRAKTRDGTPIYTYKMDWEAL